MGSGRMKAVWKRIDRYLYTSNAEDYGSHVDEISKCLFQPGQKPRTRDAARRDDGSLDSSLMLMYLGTITSCERRSVLHGRLDDVTSD